MQEQQARLHRELAEAREELARLEEKLEHRPDLGIGEGGPEIHEWELNLALRERAQAKIVSLEDALKSLDEGEYGICERCGVQIEHERLEILPHTTLCIKCAQRIRY
ncbi:MAG: TraR/DksA C4-type zinc finger protein [Chloroflexi bacterium]|nr:TraR/DksA C4-type zinc finger protein [Chloroflexota bacterium]